MNPQKLLTPLIQQLESLMQVINDSPYISREERLWIAKEIHNLSKQLKGGEASFGEGERRIALLNKRAAVDELTTLSAKIGQLNPSSPRLDALRVLRTELQEDQVAPEQARKRLQELMHT